MPRERRPLVTQFTLRQQVAAGAGRIEENCPCSRRHYRRAFRFCRTCRQASPWIVRIRMKRSKIRGPGRVNAWRRGLRSGSRHFVSLHVGCALTPSEDRVSNAVTGRDAELPGGACHHFKHGARRTSGRDEPFRERLRILRDAQDAAVNDHRGPEGPRYFDPVLAAYAFACWPTMSTRLPIARLTSMRCRPQLA